jgi:hypothetical protein
VTTLCLALLSSACCTAFVIQRSATTSLLLEGSKIKQSLNSLQFVNAHRQSVLCWSSSPSPDGEQKGDAVEASKRLKRRTRRRKVEAIEEEEEEEEEEMAVAEAPVLKSRQNSPVQLKVLDIREMEGGYAPGPTANEQFESNVRQVMTAGSTFMASSSSKKSSKPKKSPSFSNPQLDDSLAALLNDARRMQEEEDDVEVEIDEVGDLKAKIRNALSTVVTADFFVVLAFLVWFLSGIFCSSVLKDDTVQIAFNSKFILYNSRVPQYCKEMKHAKSDC